MTRLPNIQDLLDDERPDTGRRMNRVVATIMIVCAMSAILLAAQVAWETRGVSHFPDAFFAAYAAACVAIPVVVGVRSARRNGPDILVLHAIVAPVVVWLIVAILLAVIGSLNGKNVF